MRTRLLSQVDRRSTMRPDAIAQHFGESALRDEAPRRFATHL
jgi:hypothetical protein